MHWPPTRRHYPQTGQAGLEALGCIRVPRWSCDSCPFRSHLLLAACLPVCCLLANLLGPP